MKNKLLLGLVLGAFMVAPTVTFAQDVKIVWKDLGQAERNQILAKWKALPDDKKVPWIEFRDDYVDNMPAEKLKQFEDEAKDRLAREAAQEKKIAAQRAEAEKQAAIDAEKARKEAEAAAAKAEKEAAIAAEKAEKEAEAAAEKAEKEVKAAPVEEKLDAAEDAVDEAQEAIDEAQDAVADDVDAEAETETEEGISGEAQPVEASAVKPAAKVEKKEEGKLKSMLKKFF